MCACVCGCTSAAAAASSAAQRALAVLLHHRLSSTPIWGTPGTPIGYSKAPQRRRCTPLRFRFVARRGSLFAPSFICSLDCLFVYLFVRLFACVFVCSAVRSFVCGFGCTLICFGCWFIRLFVWFASSSSSSSSSESRRPVDGRRPAGRPFFFGSCAQNSEYSQDTHSRLRTQQ